MAWLLYFQSWLLGYSKHCRSNAGKRQVLRAVIAVILTLNEVKGKDLKARDEILRCTQNDSEEKLPQNDKGLAMAGADGFGYCS
jgi:hypothetical protein